MHAEPSTTQTNLQHDTQKQSINGKNEEDINKTACSQDDKSQSSGKHCCGSVSDHPTDRSVRFSQWDEELGILSTLGSKGIGQISKLDSTCSTSDGGSTWVDGCVDGSTEVPEISLNQRDYQFNISIPKQISLPTRYLSNATSLSTSVVNPGRDLLPFHEVIMRSMNGGGSAESHALSNILGHVHNMVCRSRSRMQMQPSFSWLFHQYLSHARMSNMLTNVIRWSLLITFGQSYRTRNRPSQLGQSPSILFEDVGSHNDGILPRQQYMQSILFMHMMDSEILPASFSLRITNGRSGRQDIIILGDSSFFDIYDFRDHQEDMRLDVDNMSYEELLDLEDRIGNVSTGLSEEVINKFLSHKKYFLFSEENAIKESCIICQEDYTEEDKLGTLNCGHDFHTSCIRQWLKCKNICPICKSTAISTSNPDIPTYS